MKRERRSIRPKAVAQQDEPAGEEDGLLLQAEDGPAAGPGNPRIITITGVIDSETVEKVAAQLAFLNMESPLPIMVQISSSGGGVIAGWALHEMFVTNPSPIITVGYGYVGSAATIAFQGGIRRLLTSNTTLMIHEVSLTLGEDTTLDSRDLRKQGKEMATLQRAIERLFVRRTGLSRAKIKALCKEETEFTAVRAVNAGFADNVVRGRRMPPPRNRAR
ncbi:MAG TPA: ATP-dependent Clp protease proteolytic subunit [Candidatus Eisenbacteria bacterium]|nr:ATP-dependent Clp protease proteolytic subunit [Candidatus Eisenbacteria bacterium]